jgi:hypothetical protein
MICSLQTSNSTPSFIANHRQTSVPHSSTSISQAKIYQALGKLNPQPQAKSKPSTRHPSALPHSFSLPSMYPAPLTKHLPKHAIWQSYSFFHIIQTKSPFPPTYPSTRTPARSSAIISYPPEPKLEPNWLNPKKSLNLFLVHTPCDDDPSRRSIKTQPHRSTHSSPNPNSANQKQGQSQPYPYPYPRTANRRSHSLTPPILLQLSFIFYPLIPFHLHMSVS